MISTNPTFTQRYLRVLAIAGSDSGGGAGIQADLKTWSALGCYGMTAITAITAQNTQGVRAVHAVPPAMLKAQLQAVIEDIGVDALKIGMLPTPEMVQVVVWAIDHYGLTNVVLDPVMVATSGDRLMNQETVEVQIKTLFPKVSVITPNLDEAALLLQQPITTQTDLAPAATALLALGAQAVLLKGGHLQGANVVDVLAVPGQALRCMQNTRIATNNLHGTGCSLSAAIAAYLAQGLALEDAVEQARSYVHQAIYHGSTVKTGAGHGPLNHGFAPIPLQRLVL